MERVETWLQENTAIETISVHGLPYHLNNKPSRF